jgi:hypothetical protein
VRKNIKRKEITGVDSRQLTVNSKTGKRGEAGPFGTLGRPFESPFARQTKADGPFEAPFVSQGEQDEVGRANHDKG